jgi:hypothetical protein
MEGLLCLYLLFKSRRKCMPFPVLNSFSYLHAWQQNLLTLHYILHSPHVFMQILWYLFIQVVVMICRYINQWSWDCLTTLKFPPWQPSIARISEFYKESLVMGIFFKPSRIDGFLERTGNDRSSALVVGSLLLFKSILRIMGIYPKPRSLNFCELLWLWVLN